MATIVYTEAKHQMSIGNLNLLTDKFKVMLVTTGYVPDRNHTFVDDGTLLAPGKFEVGGTGYIGTFGGSGRKEILNKSVVVDNSTFKIRLFGDNVTWSPINVGVVGGVVVIRESIISGANDSTSLLIGYTNEGGLPAPTDGGELQIRWHIGGILIF